MLGITKIGLQASLELIYPDAASPDILGKFLQPPPGTLYIAFPWQQESRKDPVSTEVHPLGYLEDVRLRIKFKMKLFADEYPYLVQYSMKFLLGLIDDHEIVHVAHIVPDAEGSP